VVAKEAVELFEKGQYDEAGEKWWALAEHARAHGNKAQECTALHNVGTALVMMHELAEAVTCYNKALQVALEAEDRAAQVELYECLAWVYRELGHAPHAVECLNSLMMLHEEAENKPGQVLATCGLGSIHDATGNYAEAAGFYEQALELAREEGDQKSVARVLGDLGTSYVQVGSYEKGVDCYEQALQMALAEGDRDREMRTYGNLAIAANLREEDEEAVAYFGKTIAIAHELGETSTEMRARGQLGLVLRALGRLDPAIDALTAAIELARAESDIVSQGEHLTHLGVTLLAHKHDAAAAEPHLAEAVGTWRECAQLLRAQLCETRVSAQQRNSDNLETAEFFDSRVDAYVLLQQALTQLGRPAEALAVAEEAHGLATRELLALGGKDHRAVGQLLGAGDESKLPIDTRLDEPAIRAIAERAGCPFLMLTLAGETEVLAWVVPADKGADLVFQHLELEPALTAAGCSSLMHAVARLHEAVEVGGSALDCRGSPRSAKGLEPPTEEAKSLP
jgi:tetratricopeptide (TPR) repeat protein